MQRFDNVSRKETSSVIVAQLTHFFETYKMFLQVFVKAFGILPIGGILAYHLPPVFPNIMDYHGDREAFCRLCLPVFDIFLRSFIFFYTQKTSTRDTRGIS